MAIPRNLGNLAQGADSSGVLGTSKGGTGSTSTTFANLTTNVTGTLPVANGGTGLTAAGTAGNVLTSNGTGFVSSAPAGGGSLILINSTNYSGTTDPTFTTGISSTYKIYKVYAEFYGSSNFETGLRFYANGGVDSTSGVYGARFLTTSNTFNNTTSSYLPFSNAFSGSGASYAYQLEITIYASFSQSGTYTAKASFAGCCSENFAILGGGSYIGGNGRNGPVTGFQFLSGVAVTGTMSLYGVKNT